MTTFNDYLDDQLKDSEFKAEYDALEVEFSAVQEKINERKSAAENE